MTKYSSDSDSSGSHRKSRSKRRYSSTSSSDSTRRRRSKSSRHNKSSRHKSKSYSTRNRRRSRSKNKISSRRSRSTSKDRRNRRSRSRDRYKRHHHHYKSKPYKRGSHRSRSTSSESKYSSTSSTSKSSSNHYNKKHSLTNPGTNSEDQLREKLLKAIKAAESADHQLKQQGVLPKEVKSRNDISSLTQRKPNSDVINDINSDGFVQKSFTSSKQKKEETISEINDPPKVVDSNLLPVDENSIFHASFFVDPKVKLDKWIKKLHQIRQRAISGENTT